MNTNTDNCQFCGICKHYAAQTLPEEDRVPTAEAAVETGALGNDAPIGELDIASRTFNCLVRGTMLKNSGYSSRRLRTIGDILAERDAKFYKSLYGFGPNCLWDLTTRMREHGFSEWADHIDSQLSYGWRVRRGWR